MESESARMSSAAEARFRIDAPNSKPRIVKVIALDGPSEMVVKRVAERGWQRATFFTSLKFDGAPRGGAGWSMQAWLSDLAGRTKDADRRGRHGGSGRDGGERRRPARRRRPSSARPACVHKVMTTSLIIGGEHASDEVLSKTLASLRPYSSMLVIANGDDYIDEMLAALRA